MEDCLVPTAQVLELSQPNPLYLGHRGSDLRYEKNRKLTEGDIWIICLTDDADLNIAELIYDPQTEFEDYVDFIELIEMPRFMLSNPTIRGGLLRIDNCPNYFDLEDDNHVFYLMVNMHSSDVLDMINLIKPITADEIIKYKKSQRYFTGKRPVTSEFLTMLKSFCDTSYWQEQKNCVLPRHNNRFAHLLLEGIGKEYRLVAEKFHKTSIEFRDHSTGYDTFEESNSRQTYYAENSLPDSKIPQIFNNHCTDLERYNFLCYLLASKKYCHYALHPEILPTLLATYEKKPEIISTLLSYAWLSLCKDQDARKYDSDTSRIWLEIDTARQLPNDPTIYGTPFFQSSYSLKPVSNDNLVAICDQATLRHRFNLFLSGTHVDLLAEMDWSKVAITGSTMSAIIPYSSALMRNCGMVDPLNISNRILVAYFDKYYTDADVDMICEFETLFELIEHVRSVQRILETKAGQSTITTIKTISIHIDHETIKSMCKQEKVPFSYDYFIANKNNDDVKEYFYQQYLIAKASVHDHNAAILSNKPDIYQELLVPGVLDDVYVIVSKSIPDLKETKHNDLITAHSISNYQIREVFRYKIKTRGIRDIEIFRCNSIRGTIQNFHLPCVRAFFKPSQTMVSILAVTSYLTGWNFNCNYYAASRRPFEIIFKYHARGYGIALTDKEQQYYNEYVKHCEHIKQAYANGIGQYRKYNHLLYQGNGTEIVFQPHSVKSRIYQLDGNVKPLDLSIIYQK